METGTRCSDIEGVKLSGKSRRERALEHWRVRWCIANTVPEEADMLLPHISDTIHNRVDG